jgi:hypothetical protein
MSFSLCIRRESCALNPPRACYRHAGDGQVCAFAKAVASQENAAVVLGLAAGRIDQALPGNKIDPDSETPVQVRQVYGVAGWSLSRTASAICVGFRPAENAKWGALA